MKVLLIFLAACALSAAMVPMERRAVNTEEEKDVCSNYTPCGWLIYKPGNVNIIDENITNLECKCSSDKSCEVNENDRSTNSFVLRCIKPKKEGAVSRL